MNFYTSDLHFGHKNVTKEGTDFDNRPFQTVEEMNAALIRRWNIKVTNADHVYVLGDLCWRSGEESIKIVKQLQGCIHLLLGNHDRLNGEYKKLFEEIVPYKELDDGGKRLILSHYPIMFYNGMHHGAIHLYGHVHNSIEEDLFQQATEKLNQINITSRCYNVGTMHWNYEPVTLEEILARR